AVNCAMDRAGPPESRATSISRVSSPRAAKTGAGARLARGLGDMAGDVLHLFGPAAVVHPECLVPPVGRDAVEAALRHDQEGAGGRLLQAELDQSRRLGGIIHLGIEGVGMPGEGD